MRRQQRTCHCEAYPFPHRYRGGKCKEVQDRKDEHDDREALNRFALATGRKIPYSAQTREEDERY